MEQKRTIPEISVDTRLLHQALQKLKPDEIISYSTLSKVIGRDVTGSARGNLTSARKIARREDDIVTFAVSKVGIKRLTNTEIVDSVGGHARKHIRRTAEVALSKIKCAPFLDLTNEQRVKASTDMSQLGAVKAFAADKMSPRIERFVDKTEPQQLAVAKTLAAFGDDEMVKK